MDNTSVHTTDNGGRGGRGAVTSRRRPGLIRTMRAKSVAVATGVVLIIAILIFGALTFYNSTMGASIDTSKYQAVFFTNGQVYFGKLHMLNGGYMKLTDVFYLQTKQVDTSKIQDASTESDPGVELIKLGSEIHGPTDAMIISKDQILFFENLKPDGKVSDSITKYNQSNN